MNVFNTCLKIAFTLTFLAAAVFCVYQSFIASDLKQSVIFAGAGLAFIHAMPSHSKD